MPGHEPGPNRPLRIVVLPAWVKTDRDLLVFFGMRQPVDGVRAPVPLALRTIACPVPLGYDAGLAHVGTNGRHIDLVDVLARLDRVAGRDAGGFAHDDVGRLHADRGHRDM